MTVRIVPASDEHVAAVSADMRQADRDEIWATNHSTPEDALRQGLRVSTYAWAGMIGDQPICLFGVSPRSIVTGEGTPWMLGTDTLFRVQKAILRNSRPCVAAMLSVYPMLVNYVDDRNEASKRWLRWLGFMLDEPAPYGVERRMFRRFYKGVI